MVEHLYVRIDNRLLHGQVVQFWIPYLGVDRLIVADDEVAGSSAMQDIYRMALPVAMQLKIVAVDAVNSTFELDRAVTLLLIRDIPSAKRIIERGIALARVTLGNVHASPERKRITDAVYLSDAELAILEEMTRTGTEIEIQTFPGEVLRLHVDPKKGARWVKS